MEFSKLKKNIQATLKKEGDSGVAKSYEKYFKHVIKFYGVKRPRTQELFKEFYKEKISQLKVEEQIQLAYSLFDSEYMEDRTIGTDILIKNVKHLNKKNVEEIGLIIKKHCNDWATCDGLAGKVLGRMIKRNGEIAYLLKPWKSSENYWKQRASCVAFVNVARFGEFNELIIDICKTCVKNKERFVQLGMGWVLRELSLNDINLVIKFIKKNYNNISREGLRYAIEKMNPELKTELLAYEK